MTYELSLRHMRFAISLFALTMAGTPLAASAADGDNAAARVLRQQIIRHGFEGAQELYVNKDEHLVQVGKVIFASKKLSLNGNIACQTCHLDSFGSADGIPNAAAIGGTGEGSIRLLSGAKLVPRNTLAFWGRGAKGFETFFWDGKVDFSGSAKISQFGSNPPSDDALVTAVHLPVVEIREMLDEDSFVERNMQESVESSENIYEAIVAQLRKFEPTASEILARKLGKTQSDLTYTDYARSIAAFIRSKFRITETKLERFVRQIEPLSSAELQGGIVFYGKGRCVSCHTGPHFSDFRFHAVAFPQLGFGKNGFGVDYGRFNVTFDPKDLYKFRTAPLYNVAKTPPYGHDGSVYTLEEAIVAHFDPLRLVDLQTMWSLDRHELYKRLTVSRETALTVGYLSQQDIDKLVAFLKTLSF